MYLFAKFNTKNVHHVQAVASTSADTLALDTTRGPFY